jgi:16S rRNA (uracil1498-N3)-methyltransferase
MSKIRIYIEPERIDNLIELRNIEIIHKIRDVLRLKTEECFYVFNGVGEEYLYKIKDIRKSCLLIEKVKRENKESIPDKRIILGFPLLKEEKVGFVLQKATEAGAFGFIPFICERSIKIKPSYLKIERWKKIIMESARQSERLWLPSIASVVNFKEMLKRDYKFKAVASTKGSNIKDVIDGITEEAFIVVGPEGDFSFAELQELKENSFQFISLSKNILRVETAAVLTVGLINYFLYEG